MNFEVKRVDPAQVVETLKVLKSEGYNVLIDLTAIDWSALGKDGDRSEDLKRAVPREKDDKVAPIASASGEEYGTPKMPEKLTPQQEEFFKPRPARFEVVYRLAKIDAATGNDLGRAEVRAYTTGESELHSVAGIYPIADWQEREVWDMFGIKFADRPDIKRLLLYEQFKGHPLRKDYPITKRQPLIGPASGERENSPTFNIIRPTVKYD